MFKLVNPFYIASPFYDSALADDVRMQILTVTGQIREAYRPRTALEQICGALNSLRRQNSVDAQVLQLCQTYGFSHLGFEFVRRDQSSALVRVTFTGSAQKVKDYALILERGVNDLCQVAKAGELTLNKKEDSALVAYLQLPVVTV